MKKRIIISNYDDIHNPYYAGGGARAIHELARHLTDRYDVTIITGKYPGARKQRVDGIKYKRVGISFGGPKLGQVAFQLCLPFLVLQNNYDVWLENFTPPFSTSMLPLFTKKKVVGLVHMLAAKDMERKYKLPFHIVENFGLSFYKQIIVTHDHTKREIRKINKKCEVVVIPNGVYLPRLFKKEKKHVLFLGRLEINQKGLDILVKAYEKVFSKTGVPLVIAGSGEKKQLTILKNITKKAEKGMIKIVGRVEGLQKQNLLNNAYCVVIPSRFETFSITALEAIANKLPVICFQIPGLSWLPDNVSIKTKPFSEVFLAKAITSIIQSKSLRERLGKNGRELSKRYKWETVGRKYALLLSN